MKDNKKITLLLDKGLELMRQKGFVATSVDEIVGELNVPKGTFYYYFKSKEEFAVQVLSHYSTLVYSSMEQQLKNTEISPVARVIGLYSDYIDQYVNSLTIGYGNFATKIVQEVGRDYPEIRENANQIFERIRDMHMKCLEEARTKGEIRKDIDLEMMAEFIIYAWEGALRRMKTTNNVKPLLIFREVMRQVLSR